ncbi:prepilin peptidase [Jeotgalibaca sp. A122]|uniref:prepilin peptidase n=1 Tax=Jeotgalibaca sp. A122 TaxID=3457322 RepID=UPI003FD25F9B
MSHFYFFMLGSAWASFLYLLAIRIPKGDMIGWSRSECDTCSKKLGAFDLVPVFSYLRNGGRCRYCYSRVPITYLLYECVGGLITLFIFNKYTGERLLLSLILYSILFLMAAIDHHYMIIPDTLQIILFSLSLLDPGSLQSLLGAITMLIITALSSITIKDGLGGGDIKFLMIAGFYLGPVPSTWLLFMAALLALISFFFKKSLQEPIPFGPYLIGAFFVIKEFFQ